MTSLLLASSAPSPLYVVYQAEWHFSEITLTSAFAVYALALLVSLVFTGGLSDAVGRRPVLVAGFALELAAMLLFVVARGTGWLFAARATQGVATAIATGALSATLLDLGPEDNRGLGPLVNSAAPGLGLAVGALGTGLLVKYAPAPTRLIFIVLAVAFALLCVGMTSIPEPVVIRRPARQGMRPQLGVPAESRGAFLAGLPCLIATWALSGLYFSLGPSVLSAIFGERDHLVGGFLLFVLAGTAAAGSILLRGVEPPRAMLGGCLTLILGVGITLIAVSTGSEVLFFIGTFVSGGGFGVAFLGAFRTLSVLAPAGQRSALVGSIYTVAYLAFSLPAIAAGVAVTQVGVSPTINAYGAGVIVLTLIAVVGFLHGRRHAEGPAPVHRGAN